jgi:hypothetical protein
MTAAQFRQLALSLAGAIESAHMQHPDFRVSGKIFASLGYPDATRAMVKLTPAQQKVVLREAPEVFEPCNGAWGRSGCTQVRLATATQKIVRPALEAAWQNIRIPTKKIARTRARLGPK